MIHGAPTRAIVQCLKSHNYMPRGRDVTDLKRAAQRRHRRRVKREIGKEDFDGNAFDGLDAWDIY